jgi:hypothetical protein
LAETISVSSKVKNELLRRVRATETVFARFRNRAFDWKTGATCLHLARAQLVAMGHRPPKIPPFRSALGARRAMDAAGYADMAAIFDGLGLVRIPPLAMLVGDLAVLPGDDGDFDAVVINAGGKLLGWHGADASRVQPIGEAMAHVTGAWRL